MRKPSILSKILTWKQLTNELASHFDTDPVKLPRILQTVLEVASEGHTRGIKQAQVPEEDKPVRGKVTKKASRKRAKASARQKAEQKKLPHLRDRISAVMEPGKPVTVREVVERLTAKEWMPISTNPRNYVNTTLANNPKTFQRLDKGQYQLKKKSPRVVDAQNTDAAVKKLSEILVEVPKGFEKKFTTGTVAKKLTVPTATADAALRQLWALKVIAKLGETTWRIRKPTSTTATQPS